MKNQLIAQNGSIQVTNVHHLWTLLFHQTPHCSCCDEIFFDISQDIKGIPDDLKQLYKTVWEISQKTVLKMAADRGAYIDQSQSLNIHIAEPNYGKLTSMHFYGWKLVSLSHLETKHGHMAQQGVGVNVFACLVCLLAKYLLNCLSDFNEAFREQ